MPKITRRLESRFANMLMLAAVFLSFGAAPLHEVLEHSGQSTACASDGDACHAERGLPGVASHPLDDCFTRDVHSACLLCTTLSQPTRGLIARADSVPAAPAKAAEIAAQLAAYHSVPATGADLTRGPPA